MAPGALELKLAARACHQPSKVENIGFLCKSTDPFANAGAGQQREDTVQILSKATGNCDSVFQECYPIPLRSYIDLQPQPESHKYQPAGLASQQFEDVVQLLMQSEILLRQATLFEMYSDPS
mmetsp:Transcript_30469/g.64697  ORF Transcript_30469/g.64697 Transcript_30469/m.64697 type:complete len:122 (+) Transcript_30469:204-569(+)